MWIMTPDGGMRRATATEAHAARVKAYDMTVEAARAEVARRAALSPLGRAEEDLAAAISESRRDWWDDAFPSAAHAAVWHAQNIERAQRRVDALRIP